MGKISYNSIDYGSIYGPTGVHYCVWAITVNSTTIRVEVLLRDNMFTDGLRPAKVAVANFIANKIKNI